MEYVSSVSFYSLEGFGIKTTQVCPNSARDYQEFNEELPFPEVHLERRVCQVLL